MPLLWDERMQQNFNDSSTFVIPTPPCVGSFSSRPTTKTVPQSGRYMFQHNEMDREFHLYIPSSYYSEYHSSTNTTTTTTNVVVGSKLVLFFHGWGLTGVDWITDSNTKSMADRMGFVLVAPTGLSDAAYGGNSSSSSATAKTSWNVGGSGTGVDRSGKDICGWNGEEEESYCYINSCPCDEKKSDCAWTHCGDDVAFVLALLDHLQQHHSMVCIDQIYAMGYSNGAMFAWELAMDERSATSITAIAPIAGLPHCGYGTSQDGSSIKAVPVLLLSGQNDKITPPGPIDRVNIHDCTVSNDGRFYYYVPASAIMRLWATDLGCDDTTTTTTEPKTVQPSTISIPNVDWTTQCRTYCTTDNPFIPRPMQLDCRTPRGHNQESWMTQVVLEFFNAHARNRPCELFGTNIKCLLEHPRCQWSNNQCMDWTGDSHSPKEVVFSVFGSVIMTLMLLMFIILCNNR